MHPFLVRSFCTLGADLGADLGEDLGEDLFTTSGSAEWRINCHKLFGAEKSPIVAEHLYSALCVRVQSDKQELDSRVYVSRDTTLCWLREPSRQRVQPALALLGV